MIRLFNVYYPTRTIVLLLCEALIVSGCFLLATALLLGPDTYLVLNYEYGGLKILGLTILTLLCSYYFDLYEPQRISARWEIYFRLLLVLGLSLFSALRDHLSFSRRRYRPLRSVAWARVSYRGAGGLAQRVRMDHRKGDVPRAGLCSGCRRTRAVDRGTAPDAQGCRHAGRRLGWCVGRQERAQRGVQCRPGGIFRAEAAGRPRHRCARRPARRVSRE